MENINDHRISNDPLKVPITNIGVGYIRHCNYVSSIFFAPKQL